MGITFFIHGIFIGFLASMPVGAIAILTVQRTINNGFLNGFTVGLGAALGDLIYASIAALGISAISDFLIKYKMPIALIGSIFLIFMGAKIFRSDIVKQLRRPEATKSKKFGDFFYSLVLAISNPFTILGFGTFFATMGITLETNDLKSILFLLAGLFLGALLWWSLICFFVSKFKKKLSLRRIVLINKISGFAIFILGFGLLLFILLFKI